MKLVTCKHCQKTEVPLGKSIKVDGIVYCEDCVNTTFPNQEALKGRQIKKEADPTICSSCGADFGSVELPRISSHPICPGCQVKIRNKTFPLWVKGFLIGIACIVLAGFVWNWKYYQAYREIKQSNAYFAAADFAKAASLMQSASNKVSEVKDIDVLAKYFKGVDLLKRDKNDEALILFDSCIGKVPANLELNALVLRAKEGSAFNKKDYKGFLAASQAYLAQDSTSPNSIAAVASAYSCIYASTGDKAARDTATNFLRRAKSIDSTDADMKEYYNVIEYRLDSRKIIDRADFKKQFPNGWSKTK